MKPAQPQPSDAWWAAGPAPNLVDWHIASAETTWDLQDVFWFGAPVEEVVGEVRLTFEATDGRRIVCLIEEFIEPETKDQQP